MSPSVQQDCGVMTSLGIHPVKYILKKHKKTEWNKKQIVVKVLSFTSLVQFENKDKSEFIDHNLIFYAQEYSTGPLLKCHL
jgi:hypothetical protein